MTLELEHIWWISMAQRTNGLLA